MAKIKEPKMEDKVVQVEELENSEENVPKVETTVSKIGDKKVVKLNKFDIFFIRVWSFICAFILKISGWITKGLTFIFKREIPQRYVTAAVATILIILVVIIITAPFNINVEKTETLDIYNSNLIAVQRKVGENTTTGEPIYKWGYANKKGVIKIDCIYEKAMDFKYNVAFVLVSEVKSSGSTSTYWKLINTKGKNVGSIQFQQVVGADPVVSTFADNKLAKVCLAGSYGYINTKGKMVIDAEYSDAGDFIDGIARVGRGSSYWFINKKGKQISDEYAYARDFVEGYAAVKTLAGNWKFINSNCEDIIEAKFDAVSDFYCGYAAVKLGGSYAIIDTSGKYVVKTNSFYDLSILDNFNIER